MTVIERFKHPADAKEDLVPYVPSAEDLASHLGVRINIAESSEGIALRTLNRRAFQIVGFACYIPT
jgi:hypothetical protein